MRDRFWYHSLLKGAVLHGLYIEREWKDSLPELGLTTAIGAASPLTVWGRKVFRPTSAPSRFPTFDISYRSF